MRYQLLSLLVAVVSAQADVDFTPFVFTSWGESNGGNDFPGVAVPFGMVKLGPDLYTGVDSYSGFQPTGNFTGFTMMHESGTGGAPKYGVVSQMPSAKTVINPLSDAINDTRVGTDITDVGYYKATLGQGTTVELGATARAGIYQYTFPAASSPNVIVDVSHVLSSYRGQGLQQMYLGGNITTTTAGHYEGWGTYNNGWNEAPAWTIFFCGDFDSPPSLVKTFLATNALGATLASYSTTPQVSSTARLGAVFTFNATTVVSRVGISFISSAQACSNRDSQIPEGTTLSTVVSSTKAIWNSEVLSKITTTDTNVTNLNLLYSSLYFMHLLPSNRTGENPIWQSAEPYYDDLFTLWDLHRCTTALVHILQPTMYEGYIRSLIDVWRHVGFMPDARSSNFNGVSQGGSNADNVLADAYVKGVRGAVNWEDGFAAMVTDAEVVPPPNHDSRDPTASTAQGRGSLPDWLNFGFLTLKYGRCGSRAVEYSVNDFALYQVASGLGNETAASKYLNRSRNWRNQWDHEAEVLGFTGFLQPRDATTHEFVAYDILDGTGYWGDAFYEATPYEYSMNAHHDINTLISFAGGPETFISRMETMFIGGLYPDGNSFNNTIINIGNEPSFTTPYLFNFVNRQDLSVKYSRFLAHYWIPTSTGLPGNSDAGAMQSWLLWNMLGLYPMTGQTTFLIGSPWLANTTITLSPTTSLTITTINGSAESIYVQSLKVNGVDWNQGWLVWDDVFAHGGEMEFVMGSVPANWTTGALPPSPATET